MIEAIVSIIASLFGIVGTLSSFYFQKKSKKLKRKLNKFSWEDINLGVSVLSRKISEEFEPEVVLCASTGAAGLVANLYFLESDKYIPVIYGSSKKIGTQFTAPIEKNRAYFYVTKRCEVYVSNEIEKYKDKKILIIEDIVLTGDSLVEEKKMLLDCGYKQENIRSAALFVSNIAVDTEKKPDFYWFELDGLSKYYYPWGRTVIGKGYD